MTEDEKLHGHFFVGFLIGSVFGTLASILFASKSGKELRADIKEKGREILKDGKEIYSDADMKAKEILGVAKHQAKELKKDADRHLSKARQKSKRIMAVARKRRPEPVKPRKETNKGEKEGLHR
ncbi:MAG: YtxH domain-containing protein [Deltaproteobacteria bacterium]|nr:YtxH domain-containing protein [Deltaproteobacteria bacterium]